MGGIMGSICERDKRRCFSHKFRSVLKKRSRLYALAAASGAFATCDLPLTISS
jgi:hypothetical protein